MIEKLIKKNSVQKTLSFKVVPIGKTQEYLDKYGIVAGDTQRKADAEKVKAMLDKFYKELIENTLVNIHYLDNLDSYIEAIENDDEKEIESAKTKLIKEIANKFSDDENFAEYFKSTVIKDVLLKRAESEDEIELLRSFDKYTSYFSDFYVIRKYLFSSDQKSNTVAYRCINDNLPKHLENVKAFEKIQALGFDTLLNLNNDYVGICGTNINDVFSVDYFPFILAQSGIDKYNTLIGGYSTSDGHKNKGINEYINEYNQTHKEKLPFFQTLYNQIMSDRTTFSFTADKFENDIDVFKAINGIYESHESKGIIEALSDIKELFENLDNAETDKIYITNNIAITNLSNSIFNDWSTIRNLWFEEYDATKKQKTIKNIEKYEEKRLKEYRKCKAFSLTELQRLIDTYSTSKKPNIINHFKRVVNEAANRAINNYAMIKDFIDEGVNGNYKNNLMTDYKNITPLKAMLDATKNIELVIKSFRCSILDKDNVFYSCFDEYYMVISQIDRLYDKIRNHVTRKPYSKSKVKLNFNYPQFMKGWSDANGSGAFLMKKGTEYFLAVIPKGQKFVSSKADKDNNYQMVVYDLLGEPNKMFPKIFFAKSNIERYAPSPEIMRIYKNGTFKKGDNFSFDDCHTLINWYKDCIAISPYTKFNYKFRPTSEYTDIGQFYNDVKSQSYKLSFKDVSAKYIDELVENGNLYLFQFSVRKLGANCHGNDKLHSIYFKMLFDERNLENVVYKLSGGAELFFREKSIEDKDRIIHYANTRIPMKKAENSNEYKVKSFDIIKDRRYTKSQYILNLAIVINYKQPDKSYINEEVRELIKQKDDNYVVGVCRGSQNLLCVTVVDSKGNIVEQHSLNVIKEYDNNGKGEVFSKQNYYELINKRADDRDAARQNWMEIKNIKELKSGYVSQVVHQICLLIEKYDACVALESLIKDRKDVNLERQVYHKLVESLVKKLNCYVDKKKEPTQLGGALFPYQLTNAFESIEKIGKQNGILFFVPSFNAGRVCPKTGYMSRIYPFSIKTVKQFKEFMEMFVAARYNKEENYFEFTYIDSTTNEEWTVCTYGERTRSYLNEKNEYVSYSTFITDDFIKLFRQFEIDYERANLLDVIKDQSSLDFVKTFRAILGVTLHSRNINTKGGEDYFISPVKADDGEFYDSRNYSEYSKLPFSADSNAAYIVALRGLENINLIKDKTE